MWQGTKFARHMKQPHFFDISFEVEETWGEGALVIFGAGYGVGRITIEKS